MCHKNAMHFVSSTCKALFCSLQTRRSDKNGVLKG